MSFFLRIVGCFCRYPIDDGARSSLTPRPSFPEIKQPTQTPTRSKPRDVPFGERFKATFRYYDAPWEPQLYRNKPAFKGALLDFSFGDAPPSTPRSTGPASS